MARIPNWIYDYDHYHKHAKRKGMQWLLIFFEFILLCNYWKHTIVQQLNRFMTKKHKWIARLVTPYHGEWFLFITESLIRLKMAKKLSMLHQGRQLRDFRKWREIIANFVETNLSALLKNTTSYVTFIMTYVRYETFMCIFWQMNSFRQLYDIHCMFQNILQN